jgi:hypothetical protein
MLTVENTSYELQLSSNYFKGIYIKKCTLLGYLMQYLNLLAYGMETLFLKISPNRSIIVFVYLLSEVRNYP